MQMHGCPYRTYGTVQKVEPPPLVGFIHFSTRTYTIPRFLPSDLVGIEPTRKDLDTYDLVDVSTELPQNQPVSFYRHEGYPNPNLLETPQLSTLYYLYIVQLASAGYRKLSTVCTVGFMLIVPIFLF